MTDPRDATIVAYLQSRTRPDAPDDLAMHVMREVDATQQARPIARSVVPLAAALAAAVAVIAVIGIGWLLGPPVAGPPPTASVSQTASSSPAQLPSPSAVPSAAGLIAGPAPCADETTGFRLQVPAAWYTNLAASDVETPSCRFFAPEPFVAERVGGAPAEVRVVLGVRTGDYGPGGRVDDRRELTINGLPALRLEIAGEPGGTLPPGYAGVVYLIGLDGELPSEATTGSWLHLSTGSDNPGAVEDNVAALDAIAQSVEALP